MPQNKESCHSCLYCSDNIFKSNEPNKPTIVGYNLCNYICGCACCKPFIFDRSSEKCHSYTGFNFNIVNKE